MKFSVLAIDFDGTIARHDRLDADVRAAIGELRAQGIVVVLATGRILDHLRRDAGDLHFVDAVVAENGAVVHFPSSGYSRTLGEPPSEPLLAALRAEGVRIDVGEVVVEAEASDATRILSIIRRLELPLSIIFNRSRLMVLPQTISKSTGVQHVLALLRLSPRNAVGIGDAENDHQLLQVCEVGVAVEWGSEALKVHADFVLPGDGPRAVADYIRALANRQRLPVPVRTRRKLLLGHGDDGQPLWLAVRGRNVLVAGDTKSGKSWVTGLLCEQLIVHGYSLCVIDPEGDYLSLEALPGVEVIGGADPLPRPRDLLRALRHADNSLVIDLSRVRHEEKVDYVRTILPSLAALRRHTGVPHRIVLDEAHHFLRDVDPAAMIDLDLNGYTLVTYRASQLPDPILRASQAVIVTRESSPHEGQALRQLCSTCESVGEGGWAALIGTLGLGEAMVLPITEETGGEPRKVRLAPRLTPHVRHIAKYLDIPVQPSRAFQFWRDGVLTPRRARTLKEFIEAVEASTTAELDGHLRRGDFSRWIEGVFGDYPLAQSLAAIEADHLNHRRGDTPQRIADAIRSRYDFLESLPAAPPS